MGDGETVFRPVGASGIPSSRTAMRYAVELAANSLGTALDLDRARTWVLIAAELRTGEFQAASVQGIELACPRPAAHMATEYEPLRDGDLRRLDSGQLQEWAADVWVDVEEPPADTYGGETASQRFERSPMADETVAFRVPASDETQIIHPPAGGIECDNCGHSIELFLPGPGMAIQEPAMVHSITQQRVCPVSAPDRPHTFAIPKGDNRG